MGPTAGATEITREMLPMMVPRWWGGTSVMMVVISRGIMTAVPEACTTRAASSSGKLGASAAARVPTLNSDMARVNTARVGTRCSSQPVMGMMTAIVSMNAVVSHCAARSVTWKSAMILVSATFIVVSLRITTKAAMSRIVMIDRSAWSSRSGGEADGDVSAWSVGDMGNLRGERWDCVVVLDPEWIAGTG